MKRYLWPLVLGCVGLLLVVVGGGMLLSKIGELGGLVPAATWEAPGEATVELDPGEYAVSQLVAGGFGTDPTLIPPGEFATVSNTGVTVEGPMGPVATRCADCNLGNEELTLGNEVYVAVSHFDVRGSGTYTISVDKGSGVMIVNRSVSSVLSGLAPGLTPIGIGGLMILGALVWFIILLFSKPRVPGPRGPTTASPFPPGQQYAQPVQPTAPAYAPPTDPTATPAVGKPAGWYPDQQSPGLLRWWDGTDWTRETYRP